MLFDVPVDSSSSLVKQGREKGPEGVGELDRSDCTGLDDVAGLRSLDKDKLLLIRCSSAPQASALTAEKQHIKDNQTLYNYWKDEKTMIEKCPQRYPHVFLVLL